MKLLKLHSSKDKPTFEELVKTYQQPIYWHIRRMVVCHDDAADVLQETFIKVFQGLGTLQKTDSVKAWIYRIATNEAIRFLSKMREKPLSDLEESESLIGKLMDSDYVNFDDRMAVDFQKAILTLTEQQRTVFNLRYYDDLSYEEISEITGSSVNTLKVAYHNAKEKIKEYMTK